MVFEASPMFVDVPSFVDILALYIMDSVKHVPFNGQFANPARQLHSFF